MRAIDSLLDIVVQQDATELRLASDQRPRLFRDATELPLTMPATSADALATLLGDLISAHESALHEQGVASFRYDSPHAGEFGVTIGRRSAAPGFDWDVRFVRRGGGERGAEPSPPRSKLPEGLSSEITALLVEALALGASDVHLTERQAPIIRVNGRLRPLRAVGSPDLAGLPLDRGQLERVLAGHTVDAGLEVPGVGRVRLNVYAASGGLSAALRLLERDAPLPSELGLPAAVQALVSLPHGLIIACGPTGSGKSSTLAALARAALALGPRVLITLEDPIEYRIPAGNEGGLVRQREIGCHVPSFADGLRDALREDPDILLVGEMRDAESITLALTAAETGHLVLSSLHSRTSASAIERIVDVYAPERQRQIRVQLADALRAVIAQRLLPRADGRGRVPAFEYLRVTHGVANMIREGKTPQVPNVMQAGRDEGMIPMERSLAELVRSGIVGLEAARSEAVDLRTLDEYLGVRR
jgi:twitching motility protein PilT